MKDKKTIKEGEIFRQKEEEKRKKTTIRPHETLSNQKTLAPTTNSSAKTNETIRKNVHGKANQVISDQETVGKEIQNPLQSGMASRMVTKLSQSALAEAQEIHQILQEIDSLRDLENAFISKNNVEQNRIIKNLFLNTAIVIFSLERKIKSFLPTEIQSIENIEEISGKVVKIMERIKAKTNEPIPPFIKTENTALNYLKQNPQQISTEDLIEDTSKIVQTISPKTTNDSIYFQRVHQSIQTSIELFKSIIKTSKEAQPNINNSQKGPTQIKIERAKVLYSYVSRILDTLEEGLGHAVIGGKNAFTKINLDAKLISTKVQDILIHGEDEEQALKEVTSLYEELFSLNQNIHNLVKLYSKFYEILIRSIDTKKLRNQQIYFVLPLLNELETAIIQSKDPEEKKALEKVAQMINSENVDIEFFVKTAKRLNKEGESFFSPKMLEDAGMIKK